MRPQSEKKVSPTRWAVSTIAGSVLLVIILLWVFLHFQTEISTPETSQIGSTLGGIAGPILNLAGLLIVYFSLREQFAANQIQINHFQEEQQRNANENTISTVFKIIDDLRIEARRLTTDVNLKNLYPKEYLSHINIQRYPDFGDVNYLRAPRLLNYVLDLDEAAAPKMLPYVAHREMHTYFTQLTQETHVLRATFAMMLYLLERSQLPVSQRLHFYTIIQAVYEPLIATLLDGVEVFRTDQPAIDKLIENVGYLQEQLDNGREAFLDLEVHEPDQWH